MSESQPPAVPTVEHIEDGFALCHPQTLQLLYSNAMFQKWFHVPTPNLPLTDVVDGLNVGRIVNRLQKRGYYTYTVENDSLTSGLPLLINLSFRPVTWQGAPYVAIHAHDHSMIKEKDALIRSHTAVIEKSNREMFRKTRQLEQKNEQLRALSSKLSKYLSPQVYNSIFTGENQVKVETYRKYLTVFFSDIEGFTRLTDQLEPEMLAGVLNSYLQEMSDIAYQYGGTIDKFIGDGILIFFGDPSSKGPEEDALACALMAMEMRERMTGLRNRWKNQGIPQRLYIRMGINSGYCTVGNFGSDNRMEYTVVGGQVNLASRLETIAEADEILISDNTFTLLQGKFRCLDKGRRPVKGLTEPVQSYSLVEYIPDAANGQSSQLETEFEGFSFQLDLERADKNKAISTLKRLIGQIEVAMIKSGPDDGQEGAD